MNRRTFLGATAIAAPVVAAGCGGGGGSTKKNTNDVNTKVKLPAYVPYRGVRPDLPGTTDGVQDGFLRYPKAVKAFQGAAPGKGGTVHAFTQSSFALPPPVSHNAYWQELNKRLGVDLKLDISPASDYTEKFAALVAGGDLPDLMQIHNTPPQLPQLLASKCADLSEHLAGDAIKDYPFLANLPTVGWKSTIFNGGIYGIPISRCILGGLMFRRDDIIAAKGLDPNPKNFTEFRKLCEGLTDTRNNVWALAVAPTQLIQEMLHCPNTWRNDGGKLTHANEVPETKQALGEAAKMFQDGLVHPDTLASPNTSWKLWFNSGKAALIQDSINAWPAYYQENTAGKSYKISGIVVPGHDGGKGVEWTGSGIISFTAFAKADSAHIKQLLALCNWMAAPFGTEEYLFRKYGVTGTDYQLQNGEPVLTSKGKAETVVGLEYVSDSAPVIYYPGQSDVTRTEYKFQKDFSALNLADPTVGLFSDTAAEKGSVMSKIIDDAQNAILQGHQPLSSWDDAVRDWRNAGGDKMRQEYQEALQHS